MKKISIIIFASIVVICTTLYILFSICRLVLNKKQSNEILNKAYKIIQYNNADNPEYKEKQDEKFNSSNGEEAENGNENIEYDLQEAGENEKYNIGDDEELNFNESQDNEVGNTENIVLEDDIIGILKIPKLTVTAPIKEGTSQEVMRTSIGHFTESDYWNGNVSLASHNGGTNAHFFENLKQLNQNDEIEYITKLGIKKYKVEKVYKISSYDWTDIVGNYGNKTNNTITLVTCINGSRNHRLCVRGVEI